MFPRRPQLPLLQVKDRSAHAALAIVAKVSTGVGILKPEIAVLLDAEPVRVQMARIAETLKLGTVSNKCDGSAAVLLDDLESVLRPGDSARAAPKGALCCRGGRGGVHPQGGG